MFTHCGRVCLLSVFHCNLRRPRITSCQTKLHQLSSLLLLQSSSRQYSSSKGDKENNAKQEGFVCSKRSVPSAAHSYVNVAASNFATIRNRVENRTRELFANVDANLKADERGFYLSPDENLFPHFKFIWYMQIVSRFVRAVFPRTFSAKYYSFMKTNMMREARAPVSRMLWLSLKHRLLNGAVSIRDVLKGAPVAVEMLCQHLRKDSLDHLVAHGVLTKEAIKSVRLRFDSLSKKQRALFNLTKEDLCHWDYTGYLKSTRVYMVKERNEGEKFFLDFYVQCLMQYKKAQSCTVIDYTRRGEKKKRMEIDLPKDYGYCMPRPVIVIMRLSQQLKPNMTHDLVITAFNFIALP